MKPLPAAKMQASSGPSPVGGIEMVQAINPKSPPMTKEEFEIGKKIYFERCAGCHGVLRKGATGKPLTTDITIDRGSRIHQDLSSPTARLAACRTGVLPARCRKKEVDIMTRYVQHEPPMPPEYGLKEMEATWKVHAKPENRPTKQMNNLDLPNLFSVTLRDAGKIALIDGATKKIVQILNTGYAVHIFAHVGFGPLPVRDRP